MGWSVARDRRHRDCLHAAVRAPARLPARLCRHGGAGPSPVTSWPAGYGLKRIRRPSIPPTRKRAAWPQAGERGPLWITAGAPDRRARPPRPGLGSRRAAISPPRCCISPGRPASECAQLSFVAALAAADTVAHLRAGRRGHGQMAQRRAGRRHARSPASCSNPRAAAAPIRLARHRHRHQSGAHPAGHRISRHLAGRAGRDAAVRRTTRLLHLAAAFAKWYDVWRADGFAADPRRLAGARGGPGHAHPRAAAE